MAAAIDGSPDARQAQRGLRSHRCSVRHVHPRRIGAGRRLREGRLTPTPSSRPTPRHPTLPPPACPDDRRRELVPLRPPPDSIPLSSKSNAGQQ